MDDLTKLMLDLNQRIFYLRSLVTLMMCGGAALLAWKKGRPSIERTLIIVGALMEGASAAVWLGITLVRNVSTRPNDMVAHTMIAILTQLLTLAGTALLVWGAVKALLRMGFLELLHQDDDLDD